MQMKALFGTWAVQGDAARARQIFWLSMASVLAIKFALAWRFPFTGDEAFFLLWGIEPAWGYSDHPPMVGWLLAGLHAVSDSPFVLRFITVLSSAFIGWGLVDILRRTLPPAQHARAWLAGALFQWLPWSLLFVLVTTDTPLIIFMALSAWLYLRADLARQARAAMLFYAGSGVALGLAGLSKYFSVLLALAYIVHLCWQRRARWRWAWPLFALSLALASINIVFNAYHGWTNIMFNLFNRNSHSALGLGNFLVYLAMMLYLLTPWLLWSLWQSRHRLRAAKQADSSAQRCLFLLFAIAFSVFLALSLLRQIGLHWVLPFIPMFIAWAALTLDAPALERGLRWTLAFGLLHAALALAFALAPTELWRKTSLYDRVVMHKAGAAVTAALRQDLPEQAVLMATAYTPAALLAYHSKSYVPVFGLGRHHSRQDDLQIDFGAFEGKTVRIFSHSPFQEAQFSPYFKQIHTQSFQVQGARFYWLEGIGFDAQAYRQGVLQDIANTYHRIPRWLPILGSPFCQRYGFAHCSPQP